MSFTESIVEGTALGWLEELRYHVTHGPAMAVGEAAAERTLAALRDALLPKLISGEIRAPAVPASAEVRTA